MVKVETLLTHLRILRHGLYPYTRVFSHSSLSERLTLFQLASRLPSNALALEIGSHIGSSALFICAGMSSRGGTLFCVDTWMNNTMPDGERDTYHLFCDNTSKYSKMIRPIRKWSTELEKTEIGGDLDLVFIDGDHSEDSVRSDYNLVSEWVKPNGFVAFHDLNLAFPGVSIVVGEAIASGKWRLVQLVESLAVLQRLSRD